MIEQLELIHRRFPTGIFIPSAVWREVVEDGQGQSGAQQVAAASWIEVLDVADTALVSMLNANLDAGEAEAIVLAREQQADVVLLDEKDARAMAGRLGLAVLGTVGILIWAKRSQLIPSLRLQLDGLQRVGKFRLSRSLYLQALKAAGE
jgi:hypothetical protein